MRHLRVGLIATALCLGAPCSADKALTLTRAGEPAASIVLAEAPSCAAQLAASELQWHIERISGARLPIVHDSSEAPPGHALLFVGDGPEAREAGLAQEGFAAQEHALRFDDGAVYIVGRDSDSFATVVYDMDDLASCANLPGFWEEQGTLHAAYDLLERHCGVRWLNPTETGTLIPQTPTLTIEGEDVRRVPSFEFRDAIGAVGDNPERYDAYTALWPESTEGFRAYEAAAYPKLRQQYTEDWQYAQAKRVSSHLFLLRMRNGGQIARCNHSLYGYYHRFWEPSDDPELAKRFVEHRPEMFAQGYEGQPPQMCYTSQALIDQLAEDARAYYDGRETGGDQGIFWNPRLPNPFPVEPMDNGSFCQCDACQAWLAPEGGLPEGAFSTGAHSDYFFNFVNEVQKRLSETHPDEGLVTLAYASHAKMPDRLTLDPRVAVQYCFWVNRMPWDRANYGREIELLRSWADEGVGRKLYLWLYYTFPVETANNGKYHCFPGFFAHAIGEQMELFHDLGYRGMFHCGYGQDVEAYVTFRLMDDVEADVDDLLDEYFEGLYGAAARPMQRLYRAIEGTYCDPDNYPAQRLSGPEVAWGYLGTAERMAEFGRLLERARSLAASERELRNVELFELGVWSYMVAGREQYAGRETAATPELSAPRVAPAGGDPEAVDWAAAGELGASWYERGGDTPASRALSGRVAHDGEYLYLELSDACDTSKLSVSPMVFPHDDWEIFVAAQRAEPYRQYAVGPTGLSVALSHGEVGGRRNVAVDGLDIRVSSDTSAPDLWVARLSLPLASIVPGGVEPGGVLYLNVLRVASPAVSGQSPYGLDTLVSHSTVHEVDRLAAVHLR